MKTECAAFVLCFTIILNNCCVPVHSQGDYQAPIDMSGEKVESREVKCLGEKFLFDNSFIFTVHALNEAIGPHCNDHVSLTIIIIIILVKSTARISTSRLMIRF